MEQIIWPMMLNGALSPFHGILQQANNRIMDGSIPSLRDLEKVLLLELGHVNRPPYPYPCLPVDVSVAYNPQQVEGCTAISFLRLCHEFLERSRHLWPQLRDVNQCRPNDPPYDNNYFLDAWHKATGTAQMHFRIPTSELESIILAIRGAPAVPSTSGINNGGYVDTCPAKPFGTAESAKANNTELISRTKVGVRPAGTMHKRQLPGRSDAASSRKRSKQMINGADNMSQKMASAAASAAHFDRTTGSSRIQQLDHLHGQSASGSPSHVSPNHLQQSIGYISTGLPNGEHIIHPPFSSTNFTHDNVNDTYTNLVQHRQFQQHIIPMHTRTMPSLGLDAARVGIAPPSPGSPSTMAQSDMSSSPGFRTRECYPCQSCTKQYTRPCDLK